MVRNHFPLHWESCRLPSRIYPGGKTMSARRWMYMPPEAAFPWRIAVSSAPLLKAGARAVEPPKLITPPLPFPISRTPLHPSPLRIALHTKPSCPRTGVRLTGGSV
ncbi:uncharacterized protein LACBIDRAFT_291931 [Laccaria bicolor S238N-H82]|uniref:Predicted protein n=1 Tax=Laccaria bicolor (strain S238N-H82 / ATCC MYA-4686) TaxID=486041 RepID=B0CQ94_LACBS|nr:uncharacterized protein LACBIDRAFT_291931 [Laccaria bicolor S238N-H82]EDR15515.1 predicted protein [Laccaria bicolor S238N-H82]|eukprot:XP_001873723.1 predicted protein [Laccaria bicolor S238N-H82]